MITASQFVAMLFACLAAILIGSAAEMAMTAHNAARLAAGL